MTANTNRYFSVLIPLSGTVKLHRYFNFIVGCRMAAEVLIAMAKFLSSSAGLIAYLTSFGQQTQTGYRGYINKHRQDTEVVSTNANRMQRLYQQTQTGYKGYINKHNQGTKVISTNTNRVQRLYQQTQTGYKGFINKHKQDRADISTNTNRIQRLDQQTQNRIQRLYQQTQTRYRGYIKKHTQDTEVTCL